MWPTNRRGIIIAGFAIAIVLWGLVAVPNFLPIEESICSREASKMDFLRKQIDQFNARFSRYPSKDAFWAELFGKPEQKPPKNYWGHVYEIEYESNGSPTLISVEFEKHCGQMGIVR